MPFNGRAYTIDMETTELAGLRTKGVTISNDYVDVTTDDDDGWRRLLADPGMRAVDVEMAGITEDEVLLAAIFEANLASKTLAINLPSSLATPGNIGGEFLITSFEQTGEYDGGVEFTASFQSTGVVTYTASSA